MTPKNESDSAEDDSRGILDEAASLDTTGIGILGQTAQVSVALPQDEDDDLVDDAVVDGEILSELIVDPPLDVAAVAATDVNVGRIHDDRIGIVIELPAEESAGKLSADQLDAPGEMIVEGIVEPEPASDSEPAGEPEVATGDSTSATSDEGTSAVTADVIVDPVIIAAANPAGPESKVKPKPKKKPRAQTATSGTSGAAPEPKPEPARVQTPEPEPAPESAVEPEQASDAEPPSREPARRGESATTAWIAAALKQDATASPTPVPTASVPAEKAKNETVKNSEEAPKSVDKPAATAITQRPAVSRPEVALTSKRLGDQLGQSTRESADLLTADRLLDPHQVTKPEPEGAWSHFLYAASGRRINIGDGKRARARKALTARISAPLAGGARFVPVLSRKGGVGKTTITALLGMALADARDDRVIAVDANPDRGTLADRIVRTHNKSVRDLVRIHDEVKGYHDVSSIVVRDATRLDVLASDADPRIAEAFSDDDYRDVADVAAHYYSLVLTDTGTGIVHSVMGATLDLADQLIIVSGLSVDEARLASETLTWLETNGYAELARRSIVVLNQSTPGSPLVRLNELEAHFATRAKSVVRMPYDSQIAGGGAIVFANLQPETRQAARELAASLVEGLRASAA
ncbi:nucleotide-binding protein [Microbacterium murale]|uniref:MinD-like ATPase involved in chromosome partitioning or flagellar assembly n=1 Tax=Microbacterium murale TaxID=1081040 RepID=A0ABU0P3R9_9MICO|nr:AAA family ATPase [Microbacterium murale]MDQ0641973.1 MinD-like ATPase involved in chromosome partitioning or flagellar assembly [Microbacterium murale]